MSDREKLRAIYMFDIGSKYQTMDPQKDSWRIWKDGIDSMKVRLPISYQSPSSEIKHAVQFSKGLFGQHEYYSLPMELCGVMTSPDAEVAEFGDPKESNHILGVARGEVVNVRAEARVFNARTNAAVLPCGVVNTNESAQVVVSDPDAHQ
ncbi:unnamed protein product, partial [Prorocentrum cordatum]